MENWAGGFLGAVEKKGISVNRNGDYGPARALQLDPDWSFIDFLHAASSRLDLIPSAKRAFNANGVEIDDCMMILDDDRMFLSQGEPFFNQKTFRDSGDSKALNNCQQTESISEVGQYSIGEYLGSGGFGEVRVGINQLSGEMVALKFLRKADICSVKAAERTGIEIQCLSSLNHPNIIRLFQRLETHKHVVLVFDLMQGDVFKYMVDRGALPENEAKALFLQVISGVEYVHKNLIVHGDLKLENLLLKDSTLDTVKIADFGLSQFYRPGVLIKCDGSGTISSSAPELFAKNSAFQGETYNLGPPLDLWSLGVVLFALLNGRLPFDGPTFTCPQPSIATLKADIVNCRYTIDNRVSLDGKDLIRGLLSKNPVDRPSIADIYDHRWMRSRQCDAKEILMKNKSGDQVVFKNFQEYCGRETEIFPETDVTKIEAAVSGGGPKRKSIVVAVESLASITTGLFGKEASRQETKTSTDGGNSLEIDVEKERDSTSGSSSSSNGRMMPLRRKEKSLGSPQSFPSFSHYRPEVSPSNGYGSVRKGSAMRECVSEKTSGTSSFLPDLGSYPSTPKTLRESIMSPKNHFQRSKRSPGLSPIPVPPVRGRESQSQTQFHSESFRSPNERDTQRVHLRPL